MNLVIDTSLNACTAALFDGDRPVAERVEEMARGHQERLGVMVAELFDAAGVAPRAVSCLAVTLGPGSFTGLRVGLSFVKGLAVGLGVPLKGIGTLEALGHHSDILGTPRMSVIDGGRGQIYVQLFDHDGEGAPLALSADSDFTPFQGIAILTGPGVGLLTGHLPRARVFAQNWPQPSALNRLSHAGHEDLTPIYMREADAKVSTRGVIGALSA